MEDMNNELGKAIEAANTQIDKMAGIETLTDYVASLNKPQTGKYLIRPCGTVEFIK